MPKFLHILATWLVMVLAFRVACHEMGVQAAIDAEDWRRLSNRGQREPEDLRIAARCIQNGSVQWIVGDEALTQAREVKQRRHNMAGWDRLIPAFGSVAQGTSLLGLALGGALLSSFAFSAAWRGVGALLLLPLASWQAIRASRRQMVIVVSPIVFATFLLPLFAWWCSSLLPSPGRLALAEMNIVADTTTASVGLAFLSLGAGAWGVAGCLAAWVSSRGAHPNATCPVCGYELSEPSCPECGWGRSHAWSKWVLWRLAIGYSVLLLAVAGVLSLGVYTVMFAQRDGTLVIPWSRTARVQQAFMSPVYAVNKVTVLKLEDGRELAFGITRGQRFANELWIRPPGAAAFVLGSIMEGAAPEVDLPDSQTSCNGIWITSHGSRYRRPDFIGIDPKVVSITVLTPEEAAALPIVPRP